MLPRAAAYCEPITGNNCCGYQQVLKKFCLTTEVCFGAKELARDCKICKSNGYNNRDRLQQRLWQTLQPLLNSRTEAVADFTV